MFKKFLTIASCLTLMFSAGAETLSPVEALSRLGKASESKAIKSLKKEAKLARTVLSADNKPAVYLFENTQGCLIVSADDIAMPLLGYADEGNIDASNLPPQLEYMLSEYAAEIEWARKAGVKAGSSSISFPAEWTAIEPLMKTKWNQTSPYNDMAPQMNGRKCYTGCVATSMAQVMKYFDYPTRGTGSITYTSRGVNQKLSMNFDERDFAWGDMLDVYNEGSYTAQQSDAVAYLMKAVGYSIEMNYSTTASGTVSNLVPAALKKYFKYDGTAYMRMRAPYSATEWNKMIYENIKNIGPVIYSGNSIQGGHSFVCDGYDGNGYFHINWGWGGMCNGYYSLNALNPTMQGAGGYYGGYNNQQDAVFGIQRPTGKPAEEIPMQITQYGSLEGFISASALMFGLTDYSVLGWANETDQDMNMRLGAKFEPVDGGNTFYMDMTANGVYSLYPGARMLYDNMFAPRIVLKNIPGGEYIVTIMCREANADAAEASSWRNVLVPYGYSDKFRLLKGSAASNVTNYPANMARLEDAKFLSEVYYGFPANMSLKLTNPYDSELTVGVCPVLMTGEKQEFYGETVLVTLAPGETVEKHQPFTFMANTGASLPTTSEPKEFTLSVYDPISGRDFGTFGKVVMKRTNNSPSVQMQAISVTNGTRQFEDGLGAYFDITDPTRIDVQVRMLLRSGYLAAPITAVISECDDQGAITDEIEEQDMPEYVYMAPGSNETFNWRVSFARADLNKMYAIQLYYTYNNQRYLIGRVKVRNIGSGVESVEDANATIGLKYYNSSLDITAANGIASTVVYSVNGSKVISVTDAGSALNLSLEGMQKGIYTVVVTDNKGVTRTAKICR